MRRCDFLWSGRLQPAVGGLKAAATLIFVLTTGCTMGPNYKRPVVVVPGQYYGATTPAEANSIADVPW